MRLFRLEHGETAYRVDFAFYASTILALTVYLIVTSAPEQYATLAGLVLVGFFGWTLLEYLLHRFVLHGVQPFHRWHLEHHGRQSALICTPTALSAGLVASLCFLPALLLSNLWAACALTLGLLTGYFGYALTHHAVHHWIANGQWLRRRKQWHAAHHHTGELRRFGVTNEFWDRIFRTAR